MAADGSIVISIDLNPNKVQSDADTINQILNGIGKNAGKDLDSNFEKSTNEVKKQAEDTSKEVQDKLGKEVEAKATLDTSKLDANAEKAKSKIYDVPERHNTDLDAHDNTKPATDSAKRNAESAASKFEHLKTVITGTFLGNFAWNAASAGINAVKNAVGGLITQGTQYNRLQQDMNAQWKTLTGSASKGRELVKETNDLATAAQNSTEMVNDLNQKFYAVTNSAGKTRDLSKAVLTLQDAFGVSDDAVKNFSMQWSQMVGNGKANAQDMMSIQNVFPKFMEELVAYERKVTHNSKLTTAQVRDMMSAGKISADTMNTVLLGMGKKYKNATDNFGQTMDGMERTIKARIPVLAGMIVKPFQEMKNPLLGKMSNWITSSGAEKAFTNFGKVVAGVMDGLMSIVNSFGMAFKANMGGLFATAKVGNLTTDFDKLGNAIKPVLQAIGSLAGIIGGNVFSFFQNTINGLIDGFTGLGKKKSALDFSGITKTVQTLGQTFNALTPYVNEALGVIGEFIGAFAKGAFESVVTVFSDLASMVGKVAQAFTNLLPGMNDTSNAVKKVADHKGAIQALGKAFGLLATAILAGKGTFKVLDTMRFGFLKIGKAITALKNVPSIISNLSKVFPALGKGIKAVQKSFDLLKLAFAANPLMAIVAAIVALGLAFYEAYKHCKPFRDFANGIGSWLKKNFDGAVRNVQAFNKAFVKGFQGIIDWVKKNWKDLALLLVNPIAGGLKLLYDNNPKFKKWVDNLGKNIRKGWDNIKKNTSNFFKNLPSNMSKGFHNYIEASHKFFSHLWGSMGDWTKKIGKKWTEFTKSFNDNRYVKAFKKGHLISTVLGDWQKDLAKKGKKFSKDWEKFSKKLNENKWIKALKKGKLFQTLFKEGQKRFKSFQKSWNKGWQSTKKKFDTNFKGMQKTTKKWGKDTDKWYQGFKKSFAKTWKRGWRNNKKALADNWSAMKRNTHQFGSNMQDWLDNFGPNFKKGWSNLSKGVREIFSDMWDKMKKLGHDAMKGLVDIVNGGINGINTVIYAFGGGKTTIKPIKLATGTGAFSGGRRPITGPTLAMVNDGFDSPETGNKEMLWRPSTGEMGIFQGRNSYAMLQAGDEVFSASETAQLMNLMGVEHFANGTGFLQGLTNNVGSFFGGIGSWVKNKVDDLKKFFDLAKKIIAHPIKYVEGIFNFKGFNSGKRAMKSLASGLFDQANKNAHNFWKTLWNMVSGQFNGGAADSDLLAAAEKFGAGKPYVWGAKGAKAFDCSGLVQYTVEHAFHKAFPAGSSGQYAATQPVSNPQPGDLVFFGEGGANHVGIYAGGDNYYSAQSSSASPNIGMGKISAVHEGPVSYRRIPGINALGKAGDNVKANNGLEKWIKSKIAPGFWKFIDKLNSMFNISVGSGGPNSAPTGDHKHWLKQAGIPESWFGGLNNIIQQESGWRVNATNPDSGAYGIPQSLPADKMASAGSDWKTNPITQLKWMYSYIKGRYGTLQNALAFRAVHGWYGNGGEFDKPTVIGVGEEGNEFVINPKKTSADPLISKAVAQRAQVAPDSPTAEISRIFDEIKFSKAAGYQTKSQSVTDSNPIRAISDNNGIDGNIMINVDLEGKTIAHASYPTIKAMQAHDITITQAGGAVPVV